MGTTSDEIFDVFTSKLSDYRYLEYTDDELKNEFDRLLRNAMSRFYACDKLTSYNKDLKEFSEKLLYDEVDILSELMVLFWMAREVSNIERFNDRLSSKDFQNHSKANLLDKILNSKKDKSNEVDKIMAEYGNRKLMQSIRGR